MTRLLNFASGILGAAVVLVFLMLPAGVLILGLWVWRRTEKRGWRALGLVAALGVAGVAHADAPPPTPPDATATQFLGEVLQVLQSLGVVPGWAILLAAVLVAVAVVLLRRIGFGAMFAAIGRYLRSLKPQPEWDPEKGTGNLSPPMDMPPGGMPVPGPGDRWDKGEP